MKKSIANIIVLALTLDLFSPILPTLPSITSLTSFDGNRKTIALDPRDSAPLILRVLALHLLILRVLALHLLNLRLLALDATLPSLASCSLFDRERTAALLKRAEIHREVHCRRHADQAIADLSKSVRLSLENRKAFCLLGEWYEEKREAEMVIRAFDSALRIDPSSAAADRMRRSC